MEVEFLTSVLSLVARTLFDIFMTGLSLEGGIGAVLIGTVVVVGRRAGTAIQGGRRYSW